MAQTHFTGPLLITGPTGNVGGVIAESDPVVGPSAFVHGEMLLDRRCPLPDNDFTGLAPGWFSTGGVCVVDEAPSAISAVNIAAAQTPTAGVALTLVSATGAGITVGQTTTNYLTNTTSTGNLLIDAIPALINLSQLPAGVAMYDPRTAISRCVRITSVGNDSTATFKIVGADFYGAPMTDTVTGANAGVVTSLKAFKWITSVTPSGTLSGSNVSVGTSDVYGFQIAAYEWPFVEIYWNNALITASTGYTAPDTTNPATSTTGDVRGTYATQSASDGTKKLTMFVSPQPWNILSTTLYGVTQA